MTGCDWTLVKARSEPLGTCSFALLMRKQKAEAIRPIPAPASPSVKQSNSVSQPVSQSVGVLSLNMGRKERTNRSNRADHHVTELAGIDRVVSFPRDEFLKKITFKVRNLRWSAEDPSSNPATGGIRLG